MSDTWTCPYCQKMATLTQPNVSHGSHKFENENKDGPLVLQTLVIVCPNKKCREYTITAALFKGNKNYYGTITDEVGPRLFSTSLKPISTAKRFPEYVPLVIRRDYEEACSIVGLSPKASATLSRRCLQGMIRDFWGISKSRLADEIDELQSKVDPTTWQAIDAVRKIGNIGAHMEKDINLVIDVDPKEAELLIGLIEVLIQEWYIHRYERSEQMKKVIAAAQTKVSAKKP